MLGQQHPILLCSECGTVGSESSVVQVECPKCGSKSLNRSLRQDSQITTPHTPQPRFQTASRLRLDSLTIDTGERIYLIGRCSTIVDRLCITALLPERHGGFGSRHVLVIDAGNSSDIYRCVNIARQYGLDIRDMLRRIVVSRPFTIYQLANLVINELPGVVRKSDTKLIIIPDMLRMFLNDPSVRICEAQYLIKDITNSLRIFNDISTIVSLNRIPPEYLMILPTFDKRVQINDDGSIVLLETENRKWWYSIV